MEELKEKEKRNSMNKYKEIYKSKHKRVILNTETGKVKEIIIDQKEREAIAKGVHLQPRGKDEKEFFDRNRQVKKLQTGEIVNIQETKRLKQEHNERQDEAEKENYEREKKERFDKFGSTKKYR